MKKFQITTKESGKVRKINVIVYDTYGEMRSATRYHDEYLHNREKTTYYRGFYGIVQSWSISPDLKKWNHKITMRLCKKSLGSKVIAHESCHVGIRIYQQDIQKTIPDVQREEKLCYLVGDINSKIIGKLYDFGFYR